MTKMPKVWWFLCLLVACTPETAPDERVHDPEPPKLVAQRVTATVKREAAWLVHVQTEHETLLTTPEHPFATPRSGWIPAGRLVPGDRVVSARFGTVRVLSVQNEKPAHPQLVFNLSVDPSHAYVVGTDQVLVHNRKCKDLADREKEIEDAERELKELKQKLATSASAEENATLKQRIAEAKSQIAKLKKQVRSVRFRQKKKTGTETEANRPEPEAAPDPEVPRTQGIAQTIRAIRDKELELEELKQKFAASAEDKGALAPRVAEVKSQIAKLKKRASDARARQKKKAGTETAPNTQRIAQVIRGIEAVEGAIGAIDGTTAGSTQRLAELKRERTRLKGRLAGQRVRDKKKSGIARVPVRERLLRGAEADYESRRLALEAAQRELSEFMDEEPQSDAERKSHAQRRAALEKKIEGLQLQHDVSKEILAGERRIAELAGWSPSTDAERQKIAEEQRDLKAMLSKKRVEQYRRDRHRTKRDDPEAHEKVLRDAREAKRRRLRTADYVADTERPRDTLELLEAELAARREEAGSERLDERTEYLTERIAVLKALVELSRGGTHIQNMLREARRRRGVLIGAGRDTTEIDQEIARLEQERNASRTRRVQLYLREALFRKLDGTTWTDAPNAMDEARLREFERELERELAEGGNLPEERLRELERELGESELIDAEVLEAIWREAEAEAEQAAIQETVQDEADDVDALLRALVESSGKSPSPERTAAVESGLQALQNELREERSAVEAADFALANLHAFLSQTQGQPGSSHHAAGAQRLAEVQQQRLQLRTDWRERMQRRLDVARQELRIMQSIERFRHEATEAELARRIALLEHEVNNPAF